MRFAFSKSAVLVHLALLTIFLASGSCRASALGTYLPLVWLALATIEMCLLFPPAVKGETIEASRRRAARGLFRDPLFFTGIAGLVFILCQTLNGPRPVGYDGAALTWRVGPPPLAGLPSCFDRSQAFQAFFWLLPAWTAALAIRHGLTRRGRLRLLDVLAALSALLALFSLIQYGRGAAWRLWGQTVAPDYYGIFAYRGFAAAFFGMMFLVAAGLLITALEDGVSSRRRRLLFAAMLLNLVAAAFTREHGALLLVGCGGLAGLVYAFAHLRRRVAQAQKIRYLAALFITLAALAFLHFVAYPENALHARFQVLRSGQVLRNGWFEERQVLCRAAWRIFETYPAYGTGTWGFRHEVGRFLSDADWERIVSGTQNPITCCCDPLQFLCELGLVGAGGLLLAILLLLVPFCRRLYLLLSANPSQIASLEESRLVRFPPVAVASLAAVVGAAAMGFYDMPFRDPLVVLVWFMLLALLPGLLPVPRGRLAPNDAPAPPREDRQKGARRWNPFARRRRHNSRREV